MTRLPHETNSELSEHPENRWVGTPLVSFLGWPMFRGQRLVSGRVKFEDSMKNPLTLPGCVCPP